ncbi:hypothetical protein [Actinoalloteichus hymeniacidonis]|uniref:Uncharacterized protein n=1 Tax=Actinoalloteichus hymeniacidonis TaxID=340345 RepID=A0AAC9HMW2_9PSEU|nr:hypothetical protein [Actinoalloteichus hymeniacidonis]AOS61745.1 hypothetical protein TL08_04575 [Actinoalloteichus hymeniacidonis]MBB5910237.1 hypothetical protein [Actinoalloteichus hymeniacidonis]
MNMHRESSPDAAVPEWERRAQDRHPARSFAFYRLFYGRDTAYGPCKAQLELSECRRRLILRPGCVYPFAVLLDRAEVLFLVLGLSGDVRNELRVTRERPRADEPTVAGLTVEQHGRRLGIAVRWGDQEMVMTFSPEQREALVELLRAGLAMFPLPPGEQPSEPTASPAEPAA